MWNLHLGYWDALHYVEKKFTLSVWLKLRSRKYSKSSQNHYFWCRLDWSKVSRCWTFLRVTWQKILYWTISISMNTGRNCLKLKWATKKLHLRQICTIITISLWVCLSLSLSLSSLETLKSNSYPAAFLQNGDSMSSNWTPNLASKMETFVEK